MLLTLFNHNTVLTLLIAAIPAYYINKYLLRTIRPKESFGRFFSYLLVSLAIAFAYTCLVVFILLKILGLPNK